MEAAAWYAVLPFEVAGDATRFITLYAQLEEECTRLTVIFYTNLKEAELPHVCGSSCVESSMGIQGSW